MSERGHLSQKAETKASPEQQCKMREMDGMKVVHLLNGTEDCNLSTTKSYKIRGTKTTKTYTLIYCDEIRVPNISHTISTRAATNRKVAETNNMEDSTRIEIDRNLPGTHEENAPNDLQTVSSSHSTDVDKDTSVNTSSIHMDSSFRDSLSKAVDTLQSLENCNSLFSIIGIRKKLLQLGIVEKLALLKSLKSRVPSVPSSSQNLAKPHCSSFANQPKRKASLNVVPN